MTESMASKTGLLFPGQGAQAVGMGKELYENFPEARHAFDTANSVLGFDITKIIFEGPDEVLRQTQYTQPAVFVTSIAAYRVFSSASGLLPENCIAAGHSLGEYSALCAAGVFSLEEGLELVKARGEYIQKASDSTPGTMAAVIGLETAKIAEICAAVKDKGVCEAVNFNSPGQVVIAGATVAVDAAVKLCQEAGAAKAIMLNVSGPFHSSLMTPASIMMREKLAAYSLRPPVFPVITNCDASPVTDGSLLADKLVRQINSPVLWEDTIRRMISMNADTFIEIGPGRVLSGLLRRIDKTKKSYNVEDKSSLDKAVTGVR